MKPLLREALRDLTPDELVADVLAWLAVLGLIWAGFVVAGAMA